MYPEIYLVQIFSGCICLKSYFCDNRLQPQNFALQSKSARSSGNILHPLEDRPSPFLAPHEKIRHFRVMCASFRLRRESEGLSLSLSLSPAIMSRRRSSPSILHTRFIRSLSVRFWVAAADGTVYTTSTWTGKEGGQREENGRLGGGGLAPSERAGEQSASFTHSALRALSSTAASSTLSQKRETRI